MPASKKGSSPETKLNVKGPSHEKAVSTRSVEALLDAELERLKHQVGMGFEVKVKWLPDTTKFKNGKQLLEEVIGDTIFIYAENPAEAMRLIPHGFAEWLLNQHTKRYRMLINKFIELFEEIQYWEKEKIIKALENLIEKVLSAEGR